MKTTTLLSKNSNNSARCRLALLLIPFALAWFALAQQARATCQEGCRTNRNTVLGDEALINNTDGAYNTAIGFNALRFNTAGVDNTGTGWGALEFNTTGGENTATGVQALLLNTTGNFNTATGVGVLQGNTTGVDNTASGVNALFENTTGSSNIALGFNAGGNLTTGNNICKFLSRQSGRVFGKTCQTEVWIRERALLPTAFSPRSDLLSRAVNQSGERKGLFYENENFTHKRLD